MKRYVNVVVYLAFLVLIGLTCWWTESGTPLWALLLSPEITVVEASGKNKGEANE